METIEKQTQAVYRSAVGPFLLSVQLSGNSQISRSGFPLGLENLENLEKWEGIFQSGKSQGILNRLEKSGKSQGKSHKILENSGNLR